MTDPTREQIDERIAEIQARVDATNDGPWFYNSYNGIFSGPKMRTYDAWFATIPDGHTVERRGECPLCGQWKQIACVAPETYEHGCRFFSDDYDRDPEIAGVPSHHGDTAIGKRAADAQFIADARQDIPWLLGQVQVLLDRIAKVREIARSARALPAEVCRCSSTVGGHDIGCAGVIAAVAWTLDPQEILAVLDGEGEKADADHV